MHGLSKKISQLFKSGIDYEKASVFESVYIFVYVSWNGLAYNGSRRSQSAPLKGLIWMGLPALVDDELANFFFDDADEDPFVEDSAERWNLVRLGQQVGLLGDWFNGQLGDFLSFGHNWVWLHSYRQLNLRFSRITQPEGDPQLDVVHQSSTLGCP